VWNGFQRALNFLGAVLNYSKRFQASKVFHRFNATGLPRIVNG